MDKLRIKQIIEPIFISIYKKKYYVGGKYIGSFSDLCMFLSKLEGLTTKERDYFNDIARQKYSHQRKKIKKYVVVQTKTLIPFNNSEDDFEKILPPKEKIDIQSNHIWVPRDFIKKLQLRDKDYEEKLENRNRELKIELEMERYFNSGLSEKHIREDNLPQINPGYVYLVKSTIMKENMLKIGKSGVNNINNRLSSYGKNRVEYRKCFVYDYHNVEIKL